MKRVSIIAMTALMAAGLVACGSMGSEDEEIAFVAGTEMTDTRQSGEMVVLTVDFTTNEFTGGYFLPLGTVNRPLEIEVDYKSPSDLGWVSLYEKSAHTKLFSGGIIWMGRGERTFPEEIFPAGIYARGRSRAAMPEITRIFHYESENMIDDDWMPFSHKEIWSAVSDLKIVRSIAASGEAFQVFAYPYLRSVGMGDPKDWYWLLFIY